MSGCNGRHFTALSGKKKFQADKGLTTEAVTLV
jgi:hypothetical protein